MHTQDVILTKCLLIVKVASPPKYVNYGDYIAYVNEVNYVN
jgi:hypothetical protein